MYAVRNIKLCTKDCLCLFVCPNKAADTENGVIDKDKCIGCKKCMEACPSHAITMVPRQYPKELIKSEETIIEMKNLAKSKVEQEQIALSLKDKETNEDIKILLQAIAKSNHIMAEDIYREAGYMIPQSEFVQDFLKDLSNNSDDDFLKETIAKLLQLIKNDTQKND
ncbi:MAG: 4Fe-4S binding protein [Bacilli bacterium]